MPNGSPTEKAVFELIERHHTEHKSRVSQLDQELKALERTQHEHSYRLEDINGRLKQGADRFADIERVTKPALWKVLTAGLLVLGLVGGWGYMLARYPDWQDVKVMIDERSPYNTDKAEVMRVVKGYQVQMPAIQLKLGIMDAKLDRIVKTLEDE